MQVKILKLKLKWMQTEHNPDKVEKLCLHQAIVGMVTDLVKLKSLNASLLYPVVMDVSPITYYSPPEPSLHLPTMQEVLHLPT